MILKYVLFSFQVGYGNIGPGCCIADGVIRRTRADNNKVLERCQKDCDNTKNCIGFEHAGIVDTPSECNILTGSCPID